MMWDLFPWSGLVEFSCRKQVSGKNVLSGAGRITGISTEGGSFVTLSSSDQVSISKLCFKVRLKLENVVPGSIVSCVLLVGSPDLKTKIEIHCRKRMKIANFSVFLSFRLASPI